APRVAVAAVAHVFDPEGVAPRVQLGDEGILALAANCGQGSAAGDAVERERGRTGERAGGVDVAAVVHADAIGIVGAGAAELADPGEIARRVHFGDVGVEAAGAGQGDGAERDRAREVAGHVDVADGIGPYPSRRVGAGAAEVLRPEQYTVGVVLGNE